MSIPETDTDLYCNVNGYLQAIEDIIKKYSQLSSIPFSLIEFLLQFGYSRDVAREYSHRILTQQVDISREEFIYAVLFLIKHLILETPKFSLPDNLLSAGEEEFGIYFL